MVYILTIEVIPRRLHSSLFRDYQECTKSTMHKDLTSFCPHKSLKSPDRACKSRVELWF